MKWLFLPLISLIVTSCNPNTPTKKQSQVLRINSYVEPVTLDTRKGIDVFSWTTQYMLFEGLTYNTKENTNALGLAKKIDISDDGTVYTFHLREAKWSNGEPITSHHIKKHWQSLLAKSFPCPTADLFYPIKNSKLVKEGTLPPEALGIKAPDNKTLIIKLESPTPHFLELTSFCAFFPVQGDAEKDPTKLITSGPFRITKWQKGAEMILEKNPHYWNASNIHLDEIRISFIKNQMTALQMYEKGELDFVGGNLSPIPADAIPSLYQTNQLEQKPIGSFTFCIFNTSRFPLNHVKLRKALSYAIHRQSIVDHVTQEKEEIATGCIAPVLKNNNRRAFFQDGNKRKAKRLFQEALEELELTPDYFNRLKITYGSTLTNTALMQAIQQQWKKTLGITIQLEPLDFKVCVDALTKRNFDMMKLGWTPQYNDQINILDLFKYKDAPKNFPLWENPKYIELLDASLKEKDPKKRLVLQEEAEQIFVDEMPVATLFYHNASYLKKDYLKGIFISPTGLIHIRNAFIDHN